MTKDDYKKLLITLLPAGSAWPAVHLINSFTKLIDALAEELSRVDARAFNVITEAYPDTCVEMLSDWERNAGLPDKCTGELGTLQQRHNALLGVLTVERSLSRQFYINIAARLGFNITIIETLDYIWQITAALDVNAVYFRADVSVAGDPLVQSANGLLECAMHTLKPAHTNITFNYI